MENIENHDSACRINNGNQLIDGMAWGLSLVCEVIAGSCCKPSKISLSFPRVRGHCELASFASPNDQRLAQAARSLPDQAEQLGREACPER